MLLKRMKRLLADDAEVLHECRRCGASLDSDTDACPECGSTDFERFEIR